MAIHKTDHVHCVVKRTIADIGNGLFGLMPRVGDNGRPFGHENSSAWMSYRTELPAGNAQTRVLGGCVGEFVRSVKKITGIICRELFVLTLANKPHLVISSKVVVECVRRAGKQLVLIGRRAS